MQGIILAICIFVFASTAGLAQSVASHKADSLFRLGKYTQAIALYAGALPAKPQVSLKIAKAYQRLGNYGEAIVFYEKAFALSDPPVQAVSTYGKLLYQLHDFKKADSVFSVLTKRFPNNPDFHYQLGLIRQKEKDSAAVLSFRSAIALDSTHQKALYELGQFQYGQKKYFKVDKTGRKALESYPNNIEIIGLLAKNALKIKKYDLAIKRYETLVSKNFGSEYVYFQLGLAHYYAKEPKKSLVQFQRALKINPENITAHYISGKCYSSLNREEKAKTSFYTAIALKKKGLGDLYRSLADVFRHQKKYGDAISYYQKALERNSEDFLSQIYLALCGEKYYKDLQTQLNYYKIFVRKFDENPGAQVFMSLARHKIDELKTTIFMEGKALGTTE